MNITQNLGMYLGTPLIRGRKNKDCFNFIIDRVQKKLSGWKAKFLSLAGRQTLVKSVVNTIPNYVMQTAILPALVCNSLDKLSRNFLWGDTESVKKTHLVNWNTVGKPKKRGGLGIRSAMATNKATVSKLGWKLMKKESSLWVKVMNNKYGGERNPRMWKKKNSASHIWREFFKCKDILSQNTKWVVGDGRTISIWNDIWCGKYKISDLTNLSSASIANMKVKDIISANNLWDTTVIDHIIPPHCKMDIMNTPLPVCSTLEDSPSWMGTSSGKFSIKSCYDIIVNGDEPDEENWLWLWKLKIPLKLILFLWILRHGKNLNNDQRMIGGMREEGGCKFCGLHESNDHIFRFCNRATVVWNSCPVSITALHDLNSSFKEWVDVNIIIHNQEGGNSKANVKEMDDWFCGRPQS